MGELVVERSGVLNLGVEGMMIMGAVSRIRMCAFVTGSRLCRGAGAIAGAATGAVFSILFGFLTLYPGDKSGRDRPRADSCSGLGIIRARSGRSLRIGLPGCANGDDRAFPVLIRDYHWSVRFLFAQDPLFYHLHRAARRRSPHGSCFEPRAGLIAAFSRRQRTPPLMRSASIRHPQVRYHGRYLGWCLCVVWQGRHLPLVYTPQWVENMSAGRGWIALALVVFASWRPLRVLAGAYLFGAVGIAQLHIQALGYDIPSQLLSSLPYIATIIVLVIISQNRRLTLINTPASLGKGFVPDR